MDVTVDPIDKFPFQREPIDIFPFGRYLTISGNWKWSTDLINKLRAVLAEGGLAPDIRMIAVAGSLARMEASELSDGDLLIVLKDDYAISHGAEVHAATWKIIAERLGRINVTIDPPNPKGVFSTVTSMKQMMEQAGAWEESVSVFGKRLLLLLESQPVYGDGEYDEIIRGLISMYSEHYVKADPSKEWVFLTNDLVRYFRTICISYQYTFILEPLKWQLRNIKLRHSRLIMYSGLLFLLGEASKNRSNKVKFLANYLRLTPLERIAFAYHENRDWNFHRIAGLYDVFLDRLSSEDFRNKFKTRVNPLPESPAISSNENTPGVARSTEATAGMSATAEPSATEAAVVPWRTADYGKRYADKDYAHLKANSDGLVSELLRFVLARHGDWSERFFEYLIF